MNSNDSFQNLKNCNGINQKTKKNDFYITEKERPGAWPPETTVPEPLTVDLPWLDAPSFAVHKIPSAVTSSSRLHSPLAPSVTSAMCRSSDYGQNPDPDLKKHVRRRSDGADCARVEATSREVCVSNSEGRGAVAAAA